MTNIENVTGNSGDDTITMATAVTAGTINLAGGTDSLTFGNFTNSATVSNVETLDGGSLADTITLATTLTGADINLRGGIDTLNLANVANTGTVAGAEKINGGTAADAITISTSISAGIVNLGAGTDSLTLDGVLNSLKISNVESVFGGAGSDSVTNTGTNAVTFEAGGGFDTYVGGTGVDTVVIANLGVSDVVSVKSFRVSGADKIALDVLGVATNDGDVFDIGGITLVNNTNIKSVADFDDLQLTVLANGGAGGFVYTADTGNLYYSADGDFTAGGTLIATITAGGTSPWTYDIAGFLLV